MSRPIKFRAWDKKQQRWAYLVLQEGGFPIAKNVAEFESIGPWLQLTGLHDKNGKEIYEGDLLRDAEWGMRNEGVFFNTEKGAFYAWWKYDKPKKGQRNDVFSGGYFDAERASHSEVIGNIYENPDLLKV